MITQFFWLCLGGSLIYYLFLLAPVQLQNSDTLALPLTILKTLSTSCFFFFGDHHLFSSFLAPSLIGIHDAIVVFDSFCSGLCDNSGFSDGFIFGGKSESVGFAVDKLSGFGVAGFFVLFIYLFIYFFFLTTLDKNFSVDDGTISSVIGILGILSILQEN